MKTQLIAMNCALEGLFDYAGMFPPAEFDLQTAVRAYREYRHGRHGWALKRLVVDAKKLHTLRDEMKREILDLRLSVVATDEDLEAIQQHFDEGLPIEMIEMKTMKREQVACLRSRLPAGVGTYIELPVELRDFEMADAIAASGMRAKLRMGGVVAEAFPGAASVAAMLKELSMRGLAFKATAGLHHPLRSRHPFTYREDSKTGVMHGFMNLLCAAALIWFGGEEDEAAQLLEEQDPRAWQMTGDAISWREWDWSADELREVRKRFFKSIGSCSFVEPIRDLEAMGWL